MQFWLVAWILAAVVLTAGPAVTNEDIMKMVQAGVAQDLILKTISDSAVDFQMKPDQLIVLKKAGIPDDIVRAMMARTSDKTTVRRAPFSSMEKVVPGPEANPVPAGSKIYLKAANGFDTQLSTALRKDKVPVVLVTEKSNADFELSGFADRDAKLTLLNLKTGAVVFAVAVNKKGAKHGPQGMAEACARRLQEAVAGDDAQR